MKLTFKLDQNILLTFFNDDKVDPDSEKCDKRDGNLTPQILLFVSQLVSGIGQTLCSTLGISYLDDNVQKSKVPAIMS